MTDIHVQEQRQSEREEAERQARLLREADKTSKEALDEGLRAEAERDRRLRLVASQEGLHAHTLAEVAHARHMTEHSLGTLIYGDDLPNPAKTEERKTLLG